MQRLIEFLEENQFEEEIEKYTNEESIRIDKEEHKNWKGTDSVETPDFLFDYIFTKVKTSKSQMYDATPLVILWN